MMSRSNGADASRRRWSGAWLACGFLYFLIGSSLILHAEAIVCDLTDYKAGIGPTAAVQGESLTVTWGQSGGTARAIFAIQNGQPLIRELSVRAQNGTWRTLARNLVPEFEVTSGVRRISNQQLAPLTKELHEKITPELIEREKSSILGCAIAVAGHRARICSVSHRPFAPVM